MAVHVQWDSEAKNAVIWTLVGRWTWLEYSNAWKTMLTLLESVEGHKPDFIFDIRHMSMLPADVISHVKARYLTLPPKAGQLLAVGVDEQLQGFWNTFTDLPYASGLKMTYFETLEEALEYSRNKRQ